jgi:ankyrin repeat protein
VNLAGSDKDTALMIAADQYQAEIVKALLDHGADPNASDRQGNTVLMRAAASKRSYQEERHPLIHLLLAAGADPRRKNLHGVTALMLLAGDGNPALPLLLEKEIEVDARDADGNTALLYAARHFASGLQRSDGWALLQKGADVNAANQQGETALTLAATQYVLDAAQLLLLRGANVNARTRRGRTALMQSIDAPKDFDNDKHVVYSPEIAKLLIAAGADVNARDAGGKTALMLATERGYSDMAADLKKAGAKE